MKGLARQRRRHAHDSIRPSRPTAALSRNCHSQWTWRKSKSQRPTKGGSIWGVVFKMFFNNKPVTNTTTMSLNLKHILTRTRNENFSSFCQARNRSSQFSDNNSCRSTSLENMTPPPREHMVCRTWFGEHDPPPQRNFAEGRHTHSVSALLLVDFVNDLHLVCACFYTMHRN